MSLEKIIAEKIRADGAIPFAEFMEMALYHPTLGYYSKPETTIGKTGDFYTSPFLSSGFGAMIARQIEEMCHLMGGDFTIVEFGGRSGLLGLDILNYLETTPAYDKLKYVLIERHNGGTRLTNSRHKTSVSVCSSARDLGHFRGCILSNELFDNFCIHRVGRKRGELAEIWVDYANDFTEVWNTPAPRVTELVNRTRGVLAGELHEVSLQAQEWFDSTMPFLDEGYLFTIDYGYLDHEFHSRNKSDGTVRCYHHHQRHFDPYINIGEQDITADVNFSDLSRYGTGHGLEPTGYVNQGHFLRALGFVDFLSSSQEAEQQKAFAADMLLNRLGTHFKILIQQKGIPKMPLRGLLFQSPMDLQILRAASR